MKRSLIVAIHSRLFYTFNSLRGPYSSEMTLRDRVLDNIAYSLLYTFWIIQTLRPKQWFKNILVFAPLAFSGNLLDGTKWIASVEAFICFCLLSGVGYIINDCNDYKTDRLHPYKKARPIASGRLPISVALVAAFLITLIALVGCFYIGPSFLVIGLIYLGLALSYSFFFKRLALVDMLVLSLGFVARAVAGSLATHLLISDWMIICVFLLALFLTLNKRWYSPNNMYSTFILDKLLTITTAALLTSYMVYVILNRGYILLASVLFVIYGLYRYIYRIHHLNHQAESENILKDRPLLIAIGCWVVCIGLITVVK